MPMMQYFSKHKPMFNADWQIWILIAIIISGITLIGIVLWKTRK